jgi:hypothetical protein
MAERVGFSKAVCYSASAFNKMPETVVLTDGYVLSHLEQQSQWKLRLTPIGLITVWTVWVRFTRHAANFSAVLGLHDAMASSSVIISASPNIGITITEFRP